MHNVPHEKQTENGSAFTEIYCNLWIFDDIYAYVSFQITRYKKLC